MKVHINFLPKTGFKQADFEVKTLSDVMIKDNLFLVLYTTEKELQFYRLDMIHDYKITGVTEEAKNANG